MMIKKLPLLTILFIGFINLSALAQGLESFPVTESWKNEIFELAPEPEMNSEVTYKILVFSLHTGFEHWVIPHTEEMVKIVAEKSGRFSVDASKDITVFEYENLKNYDAIVLNNTCPEREKRDIFWDVLNKQNLSEKQKSKKAQHLQNQLLKYVENGGGLVVLHGGITFLNKSEKFGEMLGGSFDFHPPQQEITVKVVDEDHPMTKVFKGQDFIHVDEPYYFMGAYAKKDFTPLLYFENDKIKDLNRTYDTNINYISWIKTYGKGKVFYNSLSHNAQSFQNKPFLSFMLEGLKYVVSD